MCNCNQVFSIKIIHQTSVRQQTTSGCAKDCSRKDGWAGLPLAEQSWTLPDLTHDLISLFCTSKHADRISLSRCSF